MTHLVDGVGARVRAVWRTGWRQHGPVVSSISGHREKDGKKINACVERPHLCALFCKRRVCQYSQSLFKTVYFAVLCCS